MPDMDADWSTVKLTAQKMSYYEVVNLDTDGTPLYKGERMAEIAPGQWTSQIEADILAFLERTARAHP